MSEIFSSFIASNHLFISINIWLANGATVNSHDMTPETSYRHEANVTEQISSLFSIHIIISAGVLFVEWERIMSKAALLAALQ